MLTLDTMLVVAERAMERLADYPEFVEKLERLGRERALMYKILVLTRLRRSEFASLTVGQLELDGAMPSSNLKPSTFTPCVTRSARY